jgi:flagellar hook-length control protein FliK
MNTDLSSHLAALEPTYADYAANPAANEQTAFGNYLQMAQAQPASNLDSRDPVNSPTFSSTNSSPRAGDSNSAEQSTSRFADRDQSATSHHSSSRQPAPASTTSSQHESSPSAASSQDASTTSQYRANDDGQDSRDRSSNQDASQSHASQADDAHKVKSEATTVIADVNTAATAAARAAAITGGNPLDDAQARTASARADAKSANASGSSVTVQPSQTTSASPTGSPTAAQQAAAQEATAEATTNDAAFSALKEKPARAAKTASDDPSATAAPVNSDDKTAATDPLAAATVMPAAPAVGDLATPVADPKPRQPASPRSAVTSTASAATPAQVPDAALDLGASATDETPLVADAQPVQDQRAKSAVDSLSQSTAGNANGTTATQQGSTTSATPPAAPQTALHDTNTAGGSTSAPTADTNLSQADRVRFVQRVEQAFQNLSDQGGSVRLRLSPPELGSLHLEINVSNGEMTARIQAETPAARNVLLDNLPALRERLAQHDIKVQRFDVDLMDRSGGGPSNQSSQYQNPSGQNSSGTFVRTPFHGSSESAAAAETTASRPVTGGGQLNVVV